MTKRATAAAGPTNAAGYKVEVHYDTSADRPDEGHAYMHCAECLLDWRRGVPEAQGLSPRDYARQQTAITREGKIQVRCTRHDLNIATLTPVAVKKKATTKTKGER